MRRSGALGLLVLLVVLSLGARSAGAYTWCGDVTCDGVVRSADALALLRSVLADGDTPPCPLQCDAFEPRSTELPTGIPSVSERLCGDFDCSGHVTVTDALALLVHALDPEQPLSCAATCDATEISFREATAASGIAHEGDSWGGAWGDFDADGWPDLWVTNHFERSRLYRNVEGSRFEDVTQHTLVPVPDRNDSHGAAWADFDNDGDLDLFEQIGGGGGTASATKPMPKQLYVNESGQLVQRSAELGVDYPYSRGRGVSWLDFDSDGLLDLLLLTELRPDRLYPSAIVRQRPEGGFEHQTEALGFDVPLSSKYAHYCDLRGTGEHDMVIHGGHFPQRIYRAGTVPLTEMRKTLGFPVTDLVEDSAAGDFDGDLDIDFYLVRSLAPSEVSWTGGAVVRAFLFPYLTSDEHGFVVHTDGDLSFHLEASQPIDPELVHIGAEGRHPAGPTFELSTADPANSGILDHAPGSVHGLFIGWDPARSEWTVVFGVPPDEPKQRIFNVEATSDGAVYDVTPVNIGSESPPRNRLLVNENTSFANGTVAAGLDYPTSCHSVTSADFDNDMDLDLYLVCTHRTRNLPNLLLLNRGDGTFEPAPGASGAQGSPRGLGDVALAADYDRDGFIDLFVTNGHPLKPFNSDGPDQLYRNTGNTNHWLELDLVGTRSNHDGIGATVKVTAGARSQIRQPGCTAHKWAFDERIVHFGLAANTVVDELRIDWPSGIVQTLENVAADQLLTVIEPAE